MREVGGQMLVGGCRGWWRRRAHDGVRLGRRRGGLCCGRKNPGAVRNMGHVGSAGRGWRCVCAGGKEYVGGRGGKAAVRGLGH